MWGKVAYTYGVAPLTYAERRDCRHEGEYRPNEDDWNAGWTGVCVECRALYLNTAVVDSSQ